MADDDKMLTKQNAIVDRYAQQRDSLALALLKALLGLWGGFREWYDDDMVDAQAARSAVLVETSMTKQRRLARSYAQSMLRNVDATPPSIPAQRDVYPRSGSNIIEVYRRPAEQYRYWKSTGLEDTAALEKATKRVTELAETDLMLAEREETQQVYAASPKVIGRRRIIHPELSRTGTCGLCIVAADRMYYVDELMAIHDHCNCTDAPVTAGNDPGLSLNRADLEALYAAAGSTAGSDLKRVRVTVQEHGELGPILRREGDKWLDAAGVNKRAGRRTYKPYSAMTPEEQRKSWEAIIASSERSVATLERARDAGSGTVDLTGRGVDSPVSDFNQAIKYHADLIKRYRAKLGA